MIPDTIESVDQLERAAAELLALQNRRAAVEQEMADQLAAVRATFADRLVIDTGTGSRPIVDVETQLSQAILDYVTEHPADVFPDGKKTRKFPAAVIKSRTGAPVLIVDDNAAALKKLTAKSRLGVAIGRMLKRLNLHHWLRVTSALDINAIKSARAAGKITDKQLSKYGMQYTVPTSVSVTARS